MGESRKNVHFQETLLTEDEKIYVAGGGVVLSVSNKNMQLTMQEEGVALLGEKDVNRYEEMIVLRN
jgi:hypothetical protein